jgi:hypothetical protein
MAVVQNTVASAASSHAPPTRPPSPTAIRAGAVMTRARTMPGRARPATSRVRSREAPAFISTSQRAP